MSFFNNVPRRHTFKIILLIIVFFVLGFTLLNNNNTSSNTNVQPTQLGKTNSTVPQAPVEIKKSKNLKNPTEIYSNKIQKRILFWGKFFTFSSLETQCIKNNSTMAFCPYKCEYSVDQSNFSLSKSDAIIIHGRESPQVQLPPFRLPHQRWVFFMLESAQHSWTDISYLNHTFNWTMTHRMDSDVLFPYGSLMERQDGTEPNSTYLLKRKPVAWAASNCAVVSSDRKAVVDEISKYVEVDSFGACGKFNCPSRPVNEWMCDFPQMCSELLGKSYKFYLAFENSICEDYITEKFFNALKFNMVPVVLGPSRKSYEKHAPPDAFIHVSDFTTIKELAEYIKFLDENDHKYLKYFDWRTSYEVEITYYQRGWCNLCTKLYQEDFTYAAKSKQVSYSYPSIHNWWFYIKNYNHENFKVCATGKVKDGKFITTSVS